MDIKKVELNDQIENFIEEEHQKYEKNNGVECNYTPFCFIARDDDKIIGSIAGATFFSEVYIDELVVKEEYRGQDIGTELIKAVEDYYKDKGFNNMNTCTNEFQAPKFYEKCGFELEFVRKNKDNPKLNKYFYVKYFNN
ncbi:MAG: GNAT family N-acetyltransferase [Clostridia bacterium]|nr:GNAT family N-acetyltransferase [Clostridia bacterium]